MKKYLVMTALVMTTAITATLQMSQQESALAFMDPEIDLVSSQKAPIEASGDNRSIA